MNIFVALQAKFKTVQTPTDNALFQDYLSQFIAKDDTAMAQLIQQAAARFRPLRLKKNDFLVKEGNTCHHFCYVESGILQHAIGVGGEEKTTYLAQIGRAHV